MALDISTLTFIASVIFATQPVAVFVQYKVNRSYDGLGWWLAGAVFQALGFLLLLALNFPSIWMLSVVGNPLIFAGQLLLNIGIRQFLSEKSSVRLCVLLFVAYLAAYFFFIFVVNSITGRSAVVSSSAALIALLSAWAFAAKKAERRSFSLSSTFTALVFLAYGLFQAAVTVLTLTLPPLRSYGEFSQVPIRELAFIIPTIGSMLWTFGFIIMVNQRLNAENREEKEKMAMVFEASPDANMITRLADGALIDVNAGFLAMTGFAREEIQGKSILDIEAWDRPEDRDAYMDELERTGLVRNREFAFRRKDHSSFIGMISSRRISIRDRVHVVSVIHDISERKTAEGKIQDLIRQLEVEKEAAERNAVTDSLTGLSNRRYFDEALKKEFSRLKRSVAPLSLIILDVDHFKNYNDTYGHVAGDECLRRLGSVLRRAVGRLHDTVARYGGEEFVVLLPETEQHGALALAERIRKGVEALGLPHASSETAPYVTVSLGVVTAHLEARSEPSRLVALADEAMYAAKREGRNAIRCAKAEGGLDY